MKRKAVQLRLGQRVGAFQFDGVLRGQDEERVGQRVGLTHDGDPPFLHGFEQRALGLGRGAVDLVGQHEVGEQRAGLEHELPPAVFLLEDGVAGDVAGQQVGRELDALGLQPERLGQALDEFRLAQAGQTFEQQVAARQQGGDDVIHQRFLPEEHGVQRRAERLEAGRGFGEFIVGDGGRHVGKAEGGRRKE